MVARKAPKAHYPAPYALIDTWRRAGGGIQSQLAAERKALQQAQRHQQDRREIHQSQHDLEGQRRIARPQPDVVSDAPQVHGQRRAPAPGSQDADRSHQAPAPI